ncbi:F-box/kelch-repeat protein At3g23880-like [Triticum aestivum]|uniref:F-box/kelch-repeat protein At3g23880-like n=1 Tax=Triticum aestivum TaxID=4565 RepID=UPI001D0089EF|nr:F-box/kelch-repeat protein At3g23880-like [Triticum aestivum]
MMSNAENAKVDAMPAPDSKRMKAAVVVPGLRATVAEDSMTEVLLRLTVKSVARCRAVCRSWAALLSSDEFCALYRAVARAASPVPKLLHFSPTAGFDATAAYARPLSPAPGPGQDERLFTLDYARGNRVEVLTPAPCHGLTLLYDAIARAYYVCNPATRAFARLPPSDEAAPAHWRSCSTGLGFDARSREHKVVRLVRRAYPPRGQQQDTVSCEVYTPAAGIAAGGRPPPEGCPSGCAGPRPPPWPTPTSRG